jgi:hypothetical protein
VKTVLACVATAFVVVATTATAASLISGSQIKTGTITNRAIHKGSITSNRLSSGVQKILKRVTAQSGAATPVGATGAAGSNGAAGANGANGSNGNAGNNGANGANPATEVLASGDSGWTLSGIPQPLAGPQNGPGPSIADGELRLTGGFDNSNPGPPQGAPGLAHAENVPIGDLSTLLYSFHIDRRPSSGDSFSDAPAIHVTLTGIARVGSGSTFDNLVYSPVYNDSNQVGVQYTADAMQGLWYSSHQLVNGNADQSAGGQKSFQSIAAANPGATITQISVDNGGTSPDTDGSAFSAGVDDVVLGFNGTFTRYDFGG